MQTIRLPHRLDQLDLKGLNQRMRDRYLIGMLAPGNTQTVPDVLEPLADAETCGPDEGGEEEDNAQKASFNPASLGMSFSVDGTTTELLISVRWGQYHRTDSESLKTSHGRPKKIWKRTQRGGAGYRIQLKEGPLPIWEPEEDEQPGVFVRGLVRRSSETWMVPLFLVNGQKEPKHLRDEAWLFQPELVVEAPDGAPIFKQRPSERQQRMTGEERAMAMLYRRHVSFAMGHGVSVHAETLPDDPTSAVRLSTCVAPTYDVPLTEAPTSRELPAMAGLVLDMKLLAESNDLSSALQPLVVHGDTPCNAILHLNEEGVFLQFREDTIQKWMQGVAVGQRQVTFYEAHKQWRKARHIPDPEANYPGIRYILLHTFAHALMRQLTLECGYAGASIRERIYAQSPEHADGPMAGILLYTAASDSEGTLGGLVSLGKPETLGWHIDGALAEMKHCASDPLCAEHDSREDHTLHEAACHACMFIPETSCERGNKYLDRSLLVETVKRDDLAFFLRNHD